MATNLGRETEEPLFEEGEGRPLCLSCLAPNNEVAHFCLRCGAPLTSYASTGPIERILAEGYAYRQAVERPRKLAVVLGIWLIFGVNALGAVALVGMSQGKGAGGIASIAFGVFLFAVSLTVIWRSTRNFLAGRRALALG